MCLNISPETAFTVCFWPEASTISTIRVIIVLPSAPSLLRACMSSVRRPDMAIDLIFIRFLLVREDGVRPLGPAHNHKPVEAAQLLRRRTQIQANDRVHQDPESESHGIGV